MPFNLLITYSISVTAVWFSFKIGFIDKRWLKKIFQSGKQFFISCVTHLKKILTQFFCAWETLSAITRNVSGRKIRVWTKNYECGQNFWVCCLWVWVCLRECALLSVTVPYLGNALVRHTVPFLSSSLAFTNVYIFQISWQHEYNSSTLFYFPVFKSEIRRQLWIYFLCFIIFAFCVYGGLIYISAGFDSESQDGGSHTAGGSPIFFPFPADFFPQCSTAASCSPEDMMAMLLRPVPYCPKEMGNEIGVSDAFPSLMLDFVSIPPSDIWPWPKPRPHWRMWTISPLHPTRQPAH